MVNIYEYYIDNYKFTGVDISSEMLKVAERAM